MSGGVDSSVAAYLLRQRSSPNDDTARISGLFMDNWSRYDEEGATTRYCERSERDLEDARTVCEMLDVKLHQADFSREYWTDVFEPFLEGLSAARTPNPDVSCNAVVKFGVMADHARDVLGATHVATGHYARLWYRDDDAATSTSTPSCVREGLARDRVALRRDDDDDEVDVEAWLREWGGTDDPLLLAAADATKDQSYFLCGVPSRALRNVVFPLGDLTKTETRAIAARANLPVHDKRDSTGICFVGPRRFSEFVSAYLPRDDDDDDATPARLVCVETGDVVGTLADASTSRLLTIGQGARVSGVREKWFVCGRVEQSDDDLFVCPGTHHPALYSDEIRADASSFHWVGAEPPLALTSDSSAGTMRTYCRIRHLQPLVPCTVERERETNQLVVRTDKPLRGITPGQTVALYLADGALCLGGGPIASSGPTYHQLGKELPLSLHPSGQNDVSAAVSAQRATIPTSPRGARATVRG